MELASVVIPANWVNAFNATGTFELPVLELSSHMAAITRAAPGLPTCSAEGLASWQGSPTAARDGTFVPLHDPGVSTFELAYLADKGTVTKTSCGGSESIGEDVGGGDGGREAAGGVGGSEAIGSTAQARRRSGPCIAL